MTKFNVYANGILWGEFEGKTAEDAIQTAANEHGTVDVGETQDSTEGMTAEEVKTTTDEAKLIPVSFEHSHGAHFDVFVGNRLLETVWAQCAADSASTTLRWAKKECEKRGWILFNGRRLYNTARRLHLGRT